MKILKGCLILGMLIPSPILAQDYSDIELLEAFEAQRDSVRKLRQGQATRGLTRSVQKITLDNVDEPITAITEGLNALVPEQSETGATITALPSDGSQPAALGEPTPLQPADATSNAPKTIVHLNFKNPINIRIVFAYDSASLTDDQTPKLMQMCRVIKAGDIDVYRIVGHTDAAGPEPYNEQLSLLRAKEVKRFLVDECTIPEAKLNPIGFGERFLYDQNDPRNGLNRRVEFQALG